MTHLPTELPVLDDHAAEVTLSLTGIDGPHFAQFILDHCTGQRHNIGRILEGCLHRYRQLRFIQARHREVQMITPASTNQDMARGVAAPTLSEGGNGGQNVLVISYRGGTGSAFRGELLRGQDFQTVRDQIRQEGQAVVTPEGEAILLVPPPLYTRSLVAIGKVQLRRHHVVVLESSAHILDEILSRIPAKQRPYENRKARVTISVA